MSWIHDLALRWLPVSRVGQCGALPYRHEEGALTVLLVTTRGGQRWMLPKGWPKPFRSSAASAAEEAAEEAFEEAFEEAGVRGSIAERDIGMFEHLKLLDGGKSVICDVTVHPLRVQTMLDVWPEEATRERRWLSVAEAMSLVANPSLAALLDRFAAAQEGVGASSTI